MSGMTSKIFSQTIFHDNKSVILHPKNLRRIVSADLKNIKKMFKEYRIFGSDDFEHIIGVAFETLGLEHESGKITSLLSLQTCPNLPALPPWEWDHWLYNFYDISTAHSYNTLWIHMIMWEETYEYFFFLPMIKGVFKMHPFLEYLFMIEPPNSNFEFGSITEFATKLIPKGCSNLKTTQRLYMFERKNFMMKYKIRRAVEEDNDDILPLISTHSKHLEELYGVFYISELLTSHKETGRHIIVAEHESTAVAVVILNPTVNYKVLNEEFELTPFNGLKKIHEDDDIPLYHSSIPDIAISETDLDTLLSAVQKSDVEKPDTINNIEDEQLLLVNESSSDYSLVLTSSSLYLFQDDEDQRGSEHDENQETLETHSQTTITHRDSSAHTILFRRETDPRILYMDKIEKVSSASNRPKLLKAPKFCGEDNAFCLEIAAADPEHEQSLSLILECIYECFPDRDYCIMSIPSDAPVEEWARSFVGVIPQPNGTFPNALYILHKIALLNKMDVEVMRKEHMEDIKELVSTVSKNTAILVECEIFITVDPSPYNVFVLLVEDKVVGVAVISEEYNIEDLDAHFDILPWVSFKAYKSGGYGIINSIILSPIFQAMSQYFLVELHRLGDFSVLFYKYYNNEKMIKDRPVANLLQWLVPVKPRQMPEFDMNKLEEEGYPLTRYTMNNEENFALYLSTFQICSMLRYNINAKIVVIGCSNTAISFLISLVCIQNNPNYLVVFHNVTLVCKYGLSQRVSKKSTELFVQKNFLTNNYLEMMNLKAYVNVVQGTLTKIDRKDRYIVIDDNHFLNYDLMFMMCGERFLKPLKNHRTPFLEDPENVILINSYLDGNACTLKIKELRERKQTLEGFSTDNLVVYGHYLQAFGCLQGLIEVGVRPEDIIFVQPFPFIKNIDKKARQNVSFFFNGPEVYKTVLDTIEQQGIRVYSSYYFIDWDYDPTTNLVRSVRFESKHKMIDLECYVAIFYYEKGITPRVYKVCNDAGLVFDGRLVIDNACRTNDPRIYAAGTLTKYSRRYYAAHLVHKYFNRVEIGSKLGQQIRGKLVPSYIRRYEAKNQGWNFQLDMKDRLVTIFHEPLLRYTKLPGGLYYLAIDKPGKKIPWEVKTFRENCGSIYVTGNYENLYKQGYFKLQLDEFNRVESITCLARFPMHAQNMYRLWGKHEKLLNNLQTRFEMGMINDFFKYFEEPWVYAVYHDRFNYLLGELNYIVSSSMGNEKNTLINELITMFERRRWKELSEEEETELKNKFTAMMYPKTLEDKVLDFIKENRSYLPMYAHPIVVQELLESFDKSELFKKYTCT